MLIKKTKEKNKAQRKKNKKKLHLKNIPYARSIS